jgi:hypothetical protein
VAQAIVESKTRIIDIDLRAYFDHVQHYLLLEKVARRVHDDEVMHLLKIMLKITGAKGVPQGGVISPLLSNLYLTEVDRMLKRAMETTRNGKYTYVQYARFADDLDNWRTTGNPLEPAYVRNMATYHHRRIFVFGADREPPPAYRHEVMRQLYSNSYSLQAFSAQALTQQMIPSFTFFGGHLLLFVILAGPWLLFRDRRTRPVTWSTAAVCGVAMLSLWTRPHYLAPAMAGIMIISMQALRFAGALRWRRMRVGRLLSFGALAAWLVLSAGIGVARLGEDASPKPWARQRQEIARSLEAGGGRHLILVRYDPSRHNPNDEWVFNKSDLGAGARVIWARALDDMADGQLRRYYRDRTAWSIEVDGAEGPRLRKLIP